MRKDDLLDTLRRSFDGDAWHGPAVRDVLDGVSAEDARRPPPGDAHSIWELTLHIAAWANEVARRLQGNAPSEPEEGDWPAPGNDWSDAVQRVFDARDRVLENCAQLSEAELDRHVGSSGVTYAATIEGLAQHNVYHAGQIMLLRRILGGL
ncbi:MAG TPA: DinB family protein [Longimicrobiales bacterium]